MELDIIKNKTTWNDASGSINNNFQKLKLAIATLIAEGSDLDEQQLADYLMANGYTTKEWVLAKNYLNEIALEAYGSDYISIANAKISLDVDTQGGLGNTGQGLGIVAIPSDKIITDALGYSPNKPFIYTQSEASDAWTIEHNMGRHPSVTIVDSAGSAVFGDVTYTNENQLTVTFSVAFSGKAYLN
jgi:hypothetical protein